MCRADDDGSAAHRDSGSGDTMSMGTGIDFAKINDTQCGERHEVAGQRTSLSC